jgi:hypothetical protein
VLFTVAAVLALTYVLLIRRVRLDAERIVLLATAFSILVPFLLPGMHERYFMQAEALAVAAAFLRPGRLWPVPLLVQAASFASYVPYIFAARDDPPADMRILTLTMFAALAIVTAGLLRREAISPPEPRPPATPGTTARLPEQRNPEPVLA